MRITVLARPAYNSVAAAREEGMERPYRSIGQLLAAKPPGVHTIGVDATVWDVLRLMAGHDIGA